MNGHSIVIRSSHQTHPPTHPPFQVAWEASGGAEFLIRPGCMGTRSWNKNFTELRMPMDGSTVDIWYVHLLHPPTHPPTHPLASLASPPFLLLVFYVERYLPHPPTHPTPSTAPHSNRLLSLYPPTQGRVLQGVRGRGYYP